RFDDLAQSTSRAAGRPLSFILAVLTVCVWAAVGPVFNYSDTWQLVINTGTTIITFMMVFLIQATQNRDALALHAKLDEMIRASEARNEFVGIDQDMGEEDLRRLRARDSR